MKILNKTAPVLLCAVLALTFCSCGGETETGTEVHKHDYKSEVITEAGCEETGVIKYTCSCGDSYEETIPAKGHDFVEFEKVEPTFFTDGYTVYKCSRCGATENRDPTKYSGGAIELPDIPLE